MSQALIKDIKEAIVASEQSGLFVKKGDSDLENACVKYLRYKGYNVTIPKIFSVKIEDTKHLVRHFYEMLKNKHPENHVASYNLNKDLGIAKRFVDSRIIATGASKEHALNECGEIIKTVIEREEDFNFKYTLNFSLFGQKNMMWVTEKALDIMNKGLRAQEEKEAEKLRERAVQSQDTSDLGFDLDSILERMEAEENGEKESD